MYALFDASNTRNLMNFRYDIAQRQFKELGQSYEAISKAARLPKGHLSVSTVWLICSGKGDPGDPNASTIKALFKALGLKPEYALNFQLKKSEFHLAKANGKAG